MKVRPAAPRSPAPRFLALLPLLLALVACGGGGGGGGPVPSGASGPVTLTLSDPPVCEAPAGPFLNVWVTVTRVRAHLSSSAGAGAAGWVDLVDLTQDPRQIDLLNVATTTCLLTQLGVTTELPAGTYQQLRLHLLSNNPGPGEAVPVPNMCAGTGGYNCVVTAQGPQVLLLGSQANNGIKIPPGQIVGGGIVLAPGQAADVNVDFDACSSIIQQGNGQYRLKPTLTAGQVSLTNLAITGRVVDATTLAPINGATVIVLAEIPDATGTDRVVSQTLADGTDGTFSLCPLPDATFDLVVAAVGPGGAAYGPTVLLDVDAGTMVGDVPLDPDATAPGTPATIAGVVTAVDGSGNGADADVAVTPLQTIAPAGGPAFDVTIPLLPGSVSVVAVESGPSCPGSAHCAAYALVVPAANARVGVFDPGGTVYGAAPPPPVLYRVDARATVPMSGGDPFCAPDRLVTDLDSTGAPLAVSPGVATTAETLAFTGCN